jgi:putative tricarboxylic transport membrane protein
VLKTHWIAIVLLCIPAAASARPFQPTRPVEIVVHNAPGGGSDVLARQISLLLEKQKLLPVRSTVHNRPGGGATTAMAYIAEKRGDPHTIALFTSAWLLTPILSEEARVAIWDMTPIARLVLEPAMVLVKADAPYKTLGDFIEAAKKDPGKLKQAGGSIQTRGNFVRLLLQKATGTQWTYISFPGGGERTAAILGGHMQLLVAEPQEVREYLRNGQLRALAQITGKRLPDFAGVPTLQEAGFNVRSDPTMRGVVAPPGISKAAATYWEEVFARMVRSEEWRKYLEDNLFEDGFQRGAEVVKSNQEFAAEMRVMLKDAGLKIYR